MEEVGQFVGEENHLRAGEAYAARMIGLAAGLPGCGLSPRRLRCGRIRLGHQRQRLDAVHGQTAQGLGAAGRLHLSRAALPAVSRSLVSENSHDAHHCSGGLWPMPSMELAEKGSHPEQAALVAALSKDL
jgi:hypothetical protein